MSLSSTLLTDDSFLVPELTQPSVCYAGVLARASVLVHDARDVTRATMRAYVERHVDSPVNTRAINNCRFFPATEVHLGSDAALYRYGRPALTTDTYVRLPSGTMTPIRTLHEQLDAYLLGAEPVAAPAPPSAPQRRMELFAVADVTPSALAHIDHRTVDSLLAQRLAALICAHPLGRLADGIERADADAFAAAPGHRARDAAIIYLIAMLVSRVAEAWFIEAERRLARAHAPGDEPARIAFADAHAREVTALLASVAPPPEPDADDADAFHLLGKLKAQRDYIASAMRSSTSPS